jgi:hypothetical protein
MQNVRNRSPNTVLCLRRLKSLHWNMYQSVQYQRQSTVNFGRNYLEDRKCSLYPNKISTTMCTDKPSHLTIPQTACYSTTHTLRTLHIPLHILSEHCTFHYTYSQNTVHSTTHTLRTLHIPLHILSEHCTFLLSKQDISN